eukprot:CAMPEP_0203985926 /NCGR_PEP_ID=MMETSP0360-20130528/5647_1 /ASSEMBLY_ACC=CAM_ASM_000342 /TAXON_ID=268821 /ORGANISM="Scrippsiella Hangoei, Strain SHTV-5" /LENGTH=94 /DNA_ID=CAMNT_0050925269 /DNA_START=160 /DNA_END=440 /DNA_ORIENTATION=+
MPTGLVTTWLEDRGFGFIAPDDPDIGDLFVHASELRDARSSSLRRGDRVSFQVKFNRDNGKNLATNVTVEKTAGSDRRRDSRSGSRRGSRRSNS